MPYVDPARRAVDATAAQQVTRPKLSVIRVANGDGTFSYYQQVYLVGTATISGTVNTTIGGAVPQTDSYEDTLTGDTETVPTVKLRLGTEGRNDGLVSEQFPVPTRNDDLLELLTENNRLLGAILGMMTD